MNLWRSLHSLLVSEQPLTRAIAHVLEVQQQKLSQCRTTRLISTMRILVSCRRGMINTRNGQIWWLQPSPTMRGRHWKGCWLNRWKHGRATWMVHSWGQLWEKLLEHLGSLYYWGTPSIGCLSLQNKFSCTIWCSQLVQWDWGFQSPPASKSPSSSEHIMKSR